MPFKRKSLNENDRCKSYKWPKVFKFELLSFMIFKVELHVHLEGVVRLSTIVDLQREAQEKGPE